MNCHDCRPKLGCSSIIKKQLLVLLYSVLSSTVHCYMYQQILNLLGCLSAEPHKMTCQGWLQVLKQWIGKLSNGSCVNAG